MRACLLVVAIAVAGCGQKKDDSPEPVRAAPTTEKPVEPKQPEKKPAEPDIVFGTARELMDDTAKAKGKGFILKLALFDSDKSLRDHIGESVEMRGYNDGVHVAVTIDLRAVKSAPNVKAGESVVVVFRCYKGDLKSGNVAASIERP